MKYLIVSLLLLILGLFGFYQVLLLMHIHLETFIFVILALIVLPFGIVATFYNLRYFLKKKGDPSCP